MVGVDTRAFYTRTILILLFIAMFSGGLFVFSKNESFIKNFKVYYANAYIHIWQQKLNNFINLTPTVQASEKSTLSDSIPVLMYHGIVDKPDGSNVTLEDFADQMYRMKQAGYQTITNTQFASYMRGEITLPSKSFMITFDDGRKDSFYPVDPILKELGYTATFYIITGTLDKPGNSFHMTKEELKDIMKTGRWELQPHAYNGHGVIKIDKEGNTGHFYSNKQWLDDKNRLETDEEYTRRVEDDIRKAIEDMTEYFGVDSLSFAIPFGDFGQRISNYGDAPMVMQKVLDDFDIFSFYQTPDPFNFNYPLSGDDVSMVTRIKVEPGWNGESLYSQIKFGAEKDFPYQLTKGNSGKGWVKMWGKVSAIDNKIHLEPSADNTGSGAILVGTKTWTNYRINTDINWLAGSNFSVMARAVNHNNYVAVTVTKDLIRIEQKSNGERKILKEIKNSYGIKPGTHHLEIIVFGNYLFAMIDHRVIIDADNISPNLSHGGIGYMSWDLLKGIANAEITSISVNKY